MLSYREIQQYIARFLRALGEPLIYSDTVGSGAGGNVQIDMKADRLATKITPAAQLADPLYIIESLVIWHDDNVASRAIEVIPFVGGTNYGLLYGETVANLDYTFNLITKVKPMFPLIIDRQRYLSIQGKAFAAAKNMNIRGVLRAIENSGRLVSG